MKQNYFLLLVFSLFSMSIFAQVDLPFDDLPPAPEDGKCYAKCKVPDTYATVEIQKLKKAGTTKFVKAKAEYTTVSERIMIKEASFRYTVKPATYKTVDKRVMVKAGYCTRKVIPAQYSYSQTGKRLVEAASGRWVRKKKGPACFSENPEDCYIMCWEKTPAKYAYDSERVLVKGETEENNEVAAVYKTIKVQVVDRPASYDRVEIPAVYKNVSTKVLATQGCIEDTYTTTADQYTTVTEKRLVSGGGYTGWVEILCAAKTTDNVVKSVQKRLNELGYSVGSADGILGTITRGQLAKYQKDNNLPVGNLNMETLRALGVQTN
jgi:hypothetical protein